MNTIAAKLLFLMISNLDFFSEQPETGIRKRMVIDQVANKQCDHHNDDLTVAASPEAVSAIEVISGVDMGTQAISPVDATQTQVVLVDALASGLAMSSKNANNNSNSSVDASQSEDAPGDDAEEVVEQQAEAVEAEQAPAEEDQPAEEAAPVEAAPEESAPEGGADADQTNETESTYSESIATVYTGMDDDVMSTITEGSEWGDDFAPWELQVKANEFTVRDLVTMKKEYQFRVVAVNSAGRSKPSKASDVIQPRPDQKRPSPPRALRNVGTTPSSIALQWEEPEDNGGAEILGYAIQLKAGRSKQWKEIAVDVKDLSYNVTDLTEGKT